MLSPTSVAATTAAFSLLSTIALAQWPGTAATNLPIGDGTGEQVVNKVAATKDGGCYVAWFDNRGGSYAVYLQRLDAAGVEQWPHNGVLVSGNPQLSSLVDWDLVCDSADCCVLTFTDSRAGTDLDVYAYRIAPNGSFLWGANGVTLSSNSDYEPNPRVCEAGDGDFVFVWPNTVLHTIQMQRLDPAGNPRFPGDGIAIPGDTGASPGFARVVAGGPGTGDVIVSWVRTTAFTGNKHVHAQKYDALGNALWNGGTRIAVFDAASVPIAHEPRLAADGSGGALLAWHFATGSVFSVRVQHVAAAGTELFVHNGVDPTNSANSKFDPAIVWAPATSEVFVAWNERNVAQTTWGIFAQKLDAAGATAWGATGVALLPIDTTEKLAPAAARLRNAAGNDGVAVSVLVHPTGSPAKQLQVFGLTNSGADAFPTVLASTVASDKLRLVHASTASGTQLLAWTDLRAGNSDVYAAAVDARGVLGVSLAAATIGGCGGNPAGSFAVTGRPAIGTDVVLQANNPVATQTPGATLACFVLGTATTGFPCGVPVPGFGMNGPSGELLVDPGQPYVIQVGGVWTGPTSPVPWSFAIPFTPGLIGFAVYAQGLLIDFAPAAPVLFALSDGARLVVGS